MLKAYSVAPLDDAVAQRFEDDDFVADAPPTLQHNIGGGAFPDPSPSSPGDEE